MSNVTTKEVLVFMREQAHKRAVDSTEALLSDVQSMVNELKRGRVPIQGLNAFQYQHCVADHAKLRQLEEVLELSEFKGDPK
jgi:hypothetical protein